MAVVNDIFKGIGSAVKGADELVFGGARHNEALRAKNRVMTENFAILKGNFPPEAKEAAAQRILQTVDPSTIEKMKAAGQKAYRPSGEELLNPKQQQKAAKVDAGIKPDANTKSRSASRIAAAQKQGTTFDKLDARTKNRKSAQAFFDSATDEEGNFLNPKDEERYNKAIGELDPSETPVSEQPTTNVGKRAAERDRTAAFTGPPAPDQGNAAFQGPPAGRAAQAGVEAPPDISRQFLQEQGQGQGQGDQRFADFFSGGTDPFQVNMQDTAPKPFADLGITSAVDQEQFTQLQKMLPNADLRQEVNKSPEEYKKLFDAIRKGRITNKRAVELIKESLGQ